MPSRITFSDPLGYFDYNRLQLGAACVLSDSGTIAEESSLLGFPAITMRDSVERPEALETGVIMMTGLSPEDVVTAVELTMRENERQDGGNSAPDDYLIENTSQRVVRFILSTAHRHHQWAGVRR
jgi:UDP-N-acetylglucosamine 2-epimerase (non-hydrolysing)